MRLDTVLIATPSASVVWLTCRTMAMSVCGVRIPEVSCWVSSASQNAPQDTTQIEGLVKGVIPLVKGAVEEDILLVPLVRLAWSCLIVACAVLIVTLDTTVMRIGSVRRVTGSA